MNIVSLAEGNSLWIQAKKSDTRETEDRLFRLVMNKFEASIRSTPDNRDTLNNYADVLCQKANNSIGKKILFIIIYYYLNYLYFSNNN
jgi:hypothetical protein